MLHELKILPQYFEKVLSMEKPFEVRSEKDRFFKVGDELLLREYIPRDHSYTGRICHRKITYKLCLEDDLCVLGLCRI